MTRALATLIRLRGLELDAAKRGLAAAFAAEAEAQCVTEGLVQAIALEAACAAKADSGAASFGAWLPSAQLLLQRARMTQNRSAADADRARTALAATRAALRTVERLAEQRERARAEAASRAAQHALDEIGLRGVTNPR